MGINVRAVVASLNAMTPLALRDQYLEVFGEPSRSGNKAYLVKRIAWRMQALEEGDLSERARQRAMELANDADLRFRPPVAGDTDGDRIVSPTSSRGHRPLPMPGTILAREYKGRTIEVRVLRKGFEYEGEHYRSLSAVAKAVTGSHWSGFRFFGLDASSKEGVNT